MKLVDLDGQIQHTLNILPGQHRGQPVTSPLKPRTRSDY